jgi:hypothetical protein
MSGKTTLDRDPMIVSSRRINYLPLEKTDLRRFQIDSYWTQLGGSPGAAVSDLEPTGDGYRLRYQDGAIYVRHGSLAWVRGAIAERYDAIGGATSWLGFPEQDEVDFHQGGRVSVFEHGAIYWWPDVGAIELGDVVVHYTGLVCFEETSGAGSDEPYAVIGAVAPPESRDFRTPVYEDVDDEEGVPDLLEVYRGKPYGLLLKVLLMENDEGNPDEYSDAMKAAVGAGFALVSAGLVAVSAGLAAAAAPLLAAALPVVSRELNKALGTEDDQIGQADLQVTPKQMVVLAARTPNSNLHGVGYKLETPLLSAHGGSYKVYFGLVPA